MSADFAFPAFFSYPPYFTLQPNKETQAKQVELWKQLLLGFCSSRKKYLLHLKDDSCEPFSNPQIQRTFSLEGRQVVCGALVKESKATWLDKDQTVCLVTVQTLQQWADKIVSVVKTRFSSSIMTVDEIYSGDDAAGTELEGLPEELVVHALGVLEKAGRVTFFSTEKGQGVKFAR